MTIQEQLYTYVPADSREEADRQCILRHLSRGDVIFTREAEDAHMTASAWVVSPDGRRVLMAYHNIYDSWAWLGGHADGAQDLLAVAAREVTEESGLSAPRPVSDSILSLEVLPVAAHIRRGKPVCAHLHLNVTYLFEGDDTQPLRVNAAENRAVAWVPVEEIRLRSTEPLFRDEIYPKLCRRMLRFFPMCAYPPSG